jgi:transposase-like protein
MKTKYSKAFVEQALVKVYSRGNCTIQAVAEELNINHYTLKGWMRDQAKEHKKTAQASSGQKRPQDWRVEEQLLALQESFSLTGDALNAWCRERGLFPHHLSSWKASFCCIQKSGATATVSKVEERQLKDEIEKLKRELNRKEKALAEAAALLVLQKKFRALWEEEGK